MFETVRTGESQRGIHDAIVRSVLNFIAAAHPLASDFNGDSGHLEGVDVPSLRAAAPQRHARRAGSEIWLSKGRELSMSNLARANGQHQSETTLAVISPAVGQAKIGPTNLLFLEQDRSRHAIRAQGAEIARPAGLN